MRICVTSRHQYQIYYLYTYDHQVKHLGIIIPPYIKSTNRLYRRIYMEGWIYLSNYGYFSNFSCAKQYSMGSNLI